LVNILILRLCNYDKSPDHVESAGKFTLKLYSLDRYLLNVGTFYKRQFFPFDFVPEAAHKTGTPEAKMRF
jgi:hypothetical protein